MTKSVKDLIIGLLLLARTSNSLQNRLTVMQDDPGCIQTQILKPTVQPYLAASTDPSCGKAETLAMAEAFSRAT